MKIEMDLKDEDVEKIKAQVKEEFLDEFKEDEIINCLGDLSIQEVLPMIRDVMDISNKYEKLKNQTINSLRNNEKFVVLLYWIIHEDFHC